MKKYFLTLPLVALLASCGGNTPSAAAKVKQSLPKDEVVVEKEDENYSLLIPEVLESAFAMEYEGALYHARVDLDVKGTTKLEYQEGKSKNYTQKVSVHGDVYLGYQFVTWPSEGGRKFDGGYLGYVGIQNLNVTVDVYIPSSSIEDSNSLIQNYKFSAKDVSLSLYLAEEESSVILYGDFSSAGLQSLLINLIATYLAVPGDSVEELVDMFLGPREKDSKGNYIANSRPGKVVANVTDIIDAINEQLADPESEEPAIPEIFTSHPVYGLLMMAQEWVMESVSFEIISIIAAVLEVFEPSVGVKTENDILVKASIALNLSVKDIVEKMQVEEEVPVSGNFGVLLTVGTETGASFISLEQFVLASELKISSENASGSISEKLSIEASYGDVMGDLPFPSAEEQTQYNRDIGSIIITLLPYIILLINQ